MLLWYDNDTENIIFAFILNAIFKRRDSFKFQSKLTNLKKLKWFFYIASLQISIKQQQHRAYLFIFSDVFEKNFVLMHDDQKSRH